MGLFIKDHKWYLNKLTWLVKDSRLLDPCAFTEWLENVSKRVINHNINKIGLAISMQPETISWFEMVVMHL